MKNIKLFEEYDDEREGILFNVTDIIYDGDDEDDLSDLPEELEIFVPVGNFGNNYDLNEYISDEISNMTGFTHKGFSVDFTP